MRALRVFLDSSDYSVLSDPARLTPEIQETYDYLLALVDSERVKCYYSGTIISEMAPLDATQASMAQRRVDVLARLCGTNALVSIERLFEYELANAHGLSTNLQSVHSSVGEWYPREALNFLPVTLAEHAQEIRKSIKDTGLNRQARRKAERQLTKHGIPRSKVREAIAAQARILPLDDLLQKIPMKPEDAQVMARYIAGDATPDEAATAFASSLSDPCWIIRWLSQEENLLSQFTEWLRKPAVGMTQVINLLAEQAKSIRTLDSTIGSNLSEELLGSAEWRKRQESILVNVANGLSVKNLRTVDLQLTAEIIDKKCPGLSVAVRSLFSAWWTSTTATPRPPSLSDLPDAVHAAYAPYVDLFRGDSFMAPHIAQQVKRFPVKIVPKLAKLRSSIESSLNEISASDLDIHSAHGTMRV